MTTLHSFKFTQAQAKHLSMEEFEHYAELGLIRGVGPHVLEMVERTSDSIVELRSELEESQDEVTRLTKAMLDECPECGAKLEQA